MSLSLSIGENFIVWIWKLLTCLALISGTLPELIPVISHTIIVSLAFISVPAVTTYLLSWLISTTLRLVILPNAINVGARIVLISQTKAKAGVHWPVTISEPSWLTLKQFIGAVWPNKKCCLRDIGFIITKVQPEG